MHGKNRDGDPHSRIQSFTRRGYDTKSTVPERAAIRAIIAEMSKAIGRVKPLRVADMVGWTNFTDAQWDSDGQTLVWRQREGARGTLMAQARGDDTRELTPGISVCGEVNYGGGDYVVAHRHIVYVSGGLLWRMKLEGGKAVKVTHESGAVAAPVVSAGTKMIAYVRAGADADEIWVVDWEGKEAELCVFRGDGFYMQPAWHPDGSVLGCVAWNVPQMPWDGCELRLAQLEFSEGVGCVQSVRTVAGGTDTCIFQPEFSPDGDYLCYVSDASGWGHIYVHDMKTGMKRQLTDGDADHGRPAWIQGMRTLAWSRDGSAVFALRNERGKVRLWRYGLDGSGAEIKSAAEYTEFESISAASVDNMLACVVSAGVVPQTVVAFSEDRDDGARVIARGCDNSLPAESLSNARLVTWRSAGGDLVHGLYYPPAGGVATRPPAIVISHSGPTAQRTLAFYPEVQFFVSRGYAVLQVNYRGSTGFGREYMLKMRGEWGKVDREDLLSGARFLVKNGLVDGERMVAMGSSAGAVSVLLALIHNHGIFAAGVCSYPVTDMLALSKETHRFERHYSETLLGRLPEAEAVYRRRSALLRADEIVDPLLLFHGTLDAVVAPEQSGRIAANLKRRGVAHEYHLFEGEGHGWRREETVFAYYAAIERFLRQHVRS